MSLCNKQQRSKIIKQSQISNLIDLIEVLWKEAVANNTAKGGVNMTYYLVFPYVLMPFLYSTPSLADFLA